MHRFEHISIKKTAQRWFKSNLSNRFKFLHVMKNPLHSLGLFVEYHRANSFYYIYT